VFVPFGEKNTLFLIGEGDTSFDFDPVEIEQFTLGGLLRVGGLSNAEFRGNHLVYASVGYLRKIADMPPLLGEKISVGAWWEVGSAFDDWDDKNYLNSISIGGFVETILGPIFVGASFAEGGRNNFFFAIGRFF
jgi:NTE family protein